MATTARQIISIVYALCGNCSGNELDYITAMEQYALVSSEMQQEKILAYRNPEIIKATVSFTDTTGIVNDTLTNFVEDVVYLRFNEQSCEEVPVNMLDMYEDIGQQAVAFYKDTSTGTAVPKIALAVKIMGDLDVWYEPRVVTNRSIEGNIEIEDSLKYLIATRVASNCMPYVIFEDPNKIANKPALMAGLLNQARYAKELYLEKINRIGAGNRPYSRLPFSAR